MTVGFTIEEATGRKFTFFGETQLEALEMYRMTITEVGGMSND